MPFSYSKITESHDFVSTPVAEVTVLLVSPVSCKIFYIDSDISIVPTWSLPILKKSEG